MRIPYEWLAEYVDLKGLTPKEVSDALNLSGTENEVLSDLRDFPGIVVGEILEIKKHPNADRLNVTQTKVGKEVKQIVCGATNIEVGQKVPVALAGAKIGDFEIKETEIRGVKSYGMLCSEQELGIGEDHSGIMILNPDAKVGQSLAEALSSGGVVIEAELTPNRPDCFSFIGIAREAAASLDRKIKSLNFVKAEVKSKTIVKVTVKDEEACPRYIAKAVEGIKIGPSPKWMQEWLKQAGVRPINNVVDVTNYVMLEWGQPMHAFDLDKIEGSIIVRKAKAGEELVTLDGEKRKLTIADIVIADEKKVIGLAGVMGGANSEVTEKTTKVVLEAAVFDRTSVRKTAQRLALRSEASNRFEKGIPLQLPELAIERAAGLLTEIPGGLAAKMPVKKPVVGPNTNVLSKWIWIQHVGLSVSKLRETLGVKISTEQTLEILKSLGFEAEKFDFKKEARKHLGKPYVLGASFKTHGDLAFDCSYLTDYLYSKIGKFIGFTSLAQFELGEPVEVEDLRPGDILFVNGVIEKSVTDHYFVPSDTGKEGYARREVKPERKVGHNALYIGNGRIIHARHFEYDFKTGKWVKGKKAEVVEEDLEAFTKNPEYLGARRFVENPNDWIAIDVPWWRLDVKIQEDIIEEVARIYGYDNLPSVLPKGEMPRGDVNPEVARASLVRRALVGAGFSEIISYSFVAGESLTKVAELSESLKVFNPISKEQEYMKTTMLPTLLAAAQTNQSNYDSFDVFEIGKTYKKKGELVEESQILGIVAKVSGKEKSESFFRITGALNLLAQKEHLGSLELKKIENKNLEKGQAAEIFVNGKSVGYVGMILEKKSLEFGLKVPVAVAEIDLGLLFEGATKISYKPISRFPISKRDLSLTFPKQFPATDVMKVVKKGELLIKSEITDIYEGKGLQENEKSVTIGLTFGSTERTLSDTEISEATAKIVNKLEKLGGRLRT